MGKSISQIKLATDPEYDEENKKRKDKKRRLVILEKGEELRIAALGGPWFPCFFSPRTLFGRAGNRKKYRFCCTWHKPEKGY